MNDDIYEKLGLRRDAPGEGLLSFGGRARRREYWGISIALWLVSTYVSSLLIFTPFVSSYSRRGLNPTPEQLSMMAIGVMLSILVSLLTIPVTVRRLHDRGMSGLWVIWFPLLSLLPVVGFIIPFVQFVTLALLDGVPGPNEYGPDPKGRAPVFVARPVYPQAQSPVSVTVTSPSFARTVPPSQASRLPVDRLARLKELHERGVLLDDEYAIARKKVLSEF